MADAEKLVFLSGHRKHCTNLYNARTVVRSTVLVSALFCCSMPAWTRIPLPRDTKLLREFLSWTQ